MSQPARSSCEPSCHDCADGFFATNRPLAIPSGHAGACRPLTARCQANRAGNQNCAAGPGLSYVLHLSKSPRSEELAAIEKAKAEGRRFAILPRTSASVGEWLATYAPRECTMIARSVQSRIVKLEPAELGQTKCWWSGGCRTAMLPRH